ncbi:MAG TPA: TIGR01777 family oxidoreductase [Candidatus Megaira endosymbiont of Hartmannula sinica]|nr:TIGR01777 family oxidoreductase [Candidatus Megaera endosymbiont of Hartmannula sinica]
MGNNLTLYFNSRNYNVTILTRNKQKVKYDFVKIYQNIDEIQSHYKIDAIINLAGSPINKRWNKSYKQELVNSRINVTNSIYNLINRLKIKPKTVISASAIGYYGNSGDKILDERSEATNGFTHYLCSLWEQEALKIINLGVNVKIIRLGIVLGLNGGIIKQTKLPFQMGLGGKIASGKQYMSWVHIEDVMRAIDFLLLNDGSTKKNNKNIYNLTSPNPITNSEWTENLSSVLNTPSFFNLPRVIVKFIFGEMAEYLLLNGQIVLPKALQESGFKFKYTKIKDALSDILN